MEAWTGGSNLATVGTLGSLTVTGGTILNGDLTVNGTTTTLNTEQLSVSESMIFLASGSEGVGGIDSGILVQSGSTVNQGSALYHDIDSERWSVSRGVGIADTTISPLEFVVTVKALGDDVAAAAGDLEYGVGEMAINSDGTIWIYS